MSEFSSKSVERLLMLLLYLEGFVQNWWRLWGKPMEGVWNAFSLSFVPFRLLAAQRLLSHSHTALASTKVDGDMNHPAAKRFWCGKFACLNAHDLINCMKKFGQTAFLDTTGKVGLNWLAVGLYAILQLNWQDCLQSAKMYSFGIKIKHFGGRGCTPGRYSGSSIHTMKLLALPRPVLLACVWIASSSPDSGYPSTCRLFWTLFCE